GISREAYETDDFRWDDADAVLSITSAYLVPDHASDDQRERRVKIRSLVTDRCVTCHGEEGRHELARWIPLDTYEDIERHCRPEPNTVTGAKWLIAALVGLVPLGLVSGPVFYRTSTPLAARRALMVLPATALGVAAGCWVFGRPGTIAIYVLIAAAALA